MSNNNMHEQLVLRRACTLEVLPLRRTVLIEGTTCHTEHFTGDDNPDTRHYVAVLDSRIVCCLSLMKNPYNGQPAWQLRGMATAAHLAGHGIGTALLQFAEEDTFEETKISHFWCNSQARSELFYRKNGWETVSEPFIIEGVGYHVKMHKPRVWLPRKTRLQ